MGREGGKILQRPPSQLCNKIRNQFGEHCEIFGFRVTVIEAEWNKHNWLYMHVTLHHVLRLRTKKKKSISPTSSPTTTTTTTYLWTMQVFKQGMQPLIVSRWYSVQPITVCVCEAAPLIFWCTVTSTLSLQAGKIQSLTEEERAHLLPLLRNAQWVEVVGRDAIYKEFAFKDFNQVSNLLYCIALDLQNLHMNGKNCTVPYGDSWLGMWCSVL